MHCKYLKILAIAFSKPGLDIIQYTEIYRLINLRTGLDLSPSLHFVSFRTSY